MHVVEVRLAKLASEKRLFAQNQAHEEDSEQRHGNERAGDRHEERHGNHHAPSPKVERIAKVAIRPVGHHRAGLHLRVMDSVESEAGCSPDAEHGAFGGDECGHGNHKGHGGGEGDQAQTAQRERQPLPQ